MTLTRRQLSTMHAGLTKDERESALAALNASNACYPLGAEDINDDVGCWRGAEDITYDVECAVDSP